MVNIGKGLLDRMVHGAFFGKRKIGRPLKYNIRHRGHAGWIELVFNPTSQVEQIASKIVRFAHPYLAFITYRFHVEKARDAGIRIEDFYLHKFHKEPYFQHHVYAQYFHPDTLLAKVREVKFFRNARTLYKGTKVPDWAQADKMYGWEVDAYSRQAWRNAMHEFNSECTPMQYWGEQRVEPNPLQWFRPEQFGKGNSSRMFYNEVPKPMWWRYGGNMNEDTKDEALYSFTNADQPTQLMFGLDTTTPEGRAAFKKEWDAIAELTPEIIKQEDIIYPHEIAKPVSNEAHFQRLWGYYRDHTLRGKIDDAVASGSISQGDANAATKFLGGKHTLSVSQYCMAKHGQRPDLEASEGFLAADKVLNAIGLTIPLDTKTAEPFEQQFWGNFDGHFALTEIQMREELPLFISDSSGRARAEALMEEKTKSLM